MGEEAKLIVVTVTYLFAYAIDPLIWIMAFTKFLKPKYHEKRYYIYSFLGLYAIILVKQWFVMFGKSRITMFFFPVMMVYIFTVAKVLFGASIKRKVTVFFLVYMLSGVVDNVCIVFFKHCNILVKEIMVFGSKSSIIILLIRVINLIAYLLINSCYDVYRKKERSIYIMPINIVVFSFVMNIQYMVPRDTKNNTGLRYCFYGVQFVIIALITLHIFFLVKEKTEKEKEALQRAKLSEAKLTSIQYTKDMYQEMKMIQHDMNKHYRLLAELNQQKEYDAMESYLSELYNKIHDTEDLCVSNNLILAVGISEKQQVASKEGIQFDAKLEAEQFPFTDSELNSILTNILDNAFEAVSKIKEGDKKVILTIKKVNEQEIQIYCSNTYNQDAYFEIPFLSTIKPDQCNHGYGTRIVKEIVRKHKGTIWYWKDDRQFYVQIKVGGGYIDETLDM